jgi:predicted amidohydrolase YtcJ
MTVRSTLVISPTPGWFNKSERPEIEEMMRDWAMYAGGEGFGDNYLRTTGIFISGGGDVGLAATLAAEAPYTAWASYYYDSLDAAKFRQVALLAGKHNLRGHMTGLSDATLTVFEEVDQTYGIAGKRWVTEHVSAVTDSQIARAKALGLVPTSIPPTTVWKAMPPATVPANFAAYRNIMDAGLPLVICTDNVPANPFFALWVTITRTNRYTGAALNPSQALTREQALRAMTINGAYLSFEENVKGSIEVGKLADLIIIDRDYLKVPASEIKDIKVLTTMVGGKTVYQAE